MTKNNSKYCDIIFRIKNNLKDVDEKRQLNAMNNLMLSPTTFRNLSEKYFTSFLEEEINDSKPFSDITHMYTFKNCLTFLSPKYEIYEIAFIWWWRMKNSYRYNRYFEIDKRGFIDYSSVIKRCLFVPMNCKDYNCFSNEKSYYNYKSRVFKEIYYYDINYINHNSEKNRYLDRLLKYERVKEKLFEQLYRFISFNFLLKTGFRIKI